MNRIDAFAMRHPIVYAVAVAIAFVVLLLVISMPAAGKSEMFVEAWGIVRGLVLAALAIAFAYAAGWSSSSGIGNAGGADSWRIIVPPFVYLGVVYPYLFTGSWAPNLRDPKLTVLDGANAFLAGATEELIFRALIFFVVVRAWGGGRTAAVRAAILSATLFSLPHLLNVLDGHQLLRVLAQIGWAFILGIAISWLAYAGRSIWPVAFLHGGLDVVVSVNRLGMKIEITPQKGLVMVAASLPVLVYAWIVLRRARA